MDDNNRGFSDAMYSLAYTSDLTTVVFSLNIGQYRGHSPFTNVTNVEDATRLC